MKTYDNLQSKDSLYFKDIKKNTNTYASSGGYLSLSNKGQLELIKGMAERGSSLRTTVRGFSMSPFIRDRDIVTIEPINNKLLMVGDIVAFEFLDSGKMAIHRVVNKKGSFYLLKGDNCEVADGLIDIEQIIGKVVRIERNSREISLGLGPEKKIIALLNRGPGLLYLKQIRGISRRAMHFVLGMKKKK